MLQLNMSLTGSESKICTTTGAGVNFFRSKIGFRPKKFGLWSPLVDISFMSSLIKFIKRSISLLAHELCFFLIQIFLMQIFWLRDCTNHSLNIYSKFFVNAIFTAPRFDTVYFRLGKKFIFILLQVFTDNTKRFLDSSSRILLTHRKLKTFTINT